MLELLARTHRSADDPDGGLVHRARLPARAAETVPLPQLPTPLSDRLAEAGITGLWSHQAEARALLQAGHHVVVATGTASGKSLAYQLPALELLVHDDRAAVLYLAPTKALAHDQLRALRQLRVPGVRAAALDGDTATRERQAVRRTANWVLTNPDLLHHALLPEHAAWADLLHRVQLVIVDEAHTARGVLGGHVALVLRRLRRLAERYGASPTFALTSATIGNPAEHATALVGTPVVAVTRDGAPHGPVDLGLWLPPLEDDAVDGTTTDPGTDLGQPGAGVAAELAARRRSLLHEAGDLTAALVAGGLQTLTFTRSRKGAEVVAMLARERLGDDPLSDGVRTYRGGYLPEERRALEAGLRDGHIRGLVSTSALELGIDVAGLDAVVLAGWPGTTAAFWQRLGRAGRRGDAAVGVLVAQEDPLDHYLVTHPEELLTRTPEDAAVDPANPHLLGPHLRCAAHEAPLDATEAARWFGPSAPQLLADDVRAGVLRERRGRHHWIGRDRPSALIDLRGAGGATIRIVDTDTGAVVGDVDEARSHRQVHDGAVYLHQGRVLRVARLDLDQHVALAAETSERSLTTRPRTHTDVAVIDELAGTDGDGVDLRLGQVEVTTQVVGYELLRVGSGEVIDRVELDLPPVELVTMAVWYAVDAELLTEAAGLPPSRIPGALHAAEHAAIGLLPLLALCDRWDLGGLSSAHHPDTDRPTVFIYDGIPGGAGLAERSARRFAEHVSLTRETIAGCRCDDGCPSCVQSPKCGNGNDPLDKAGALGLLDLVRRRGPATVGAVSRPAAAARRAVDAVRR